MNLLSVSWIFFQEMVDFWPRPIQFCCALWFPCGEGNGNPLQYSCLENSVGRGAYWATVHGITQSRTWLKWLSSSSSSNMVPLGVAIGGNDPYLSHRVLHLSSPLLQFTRLNLMCACVCSVTQSCLTLCDPMDYSPQGYSVCGISQARIFEWVAISYSRAFSRLRDQTASVVLPTLAGGFFTTVPRETQTLWNCHSKKKMKFKNSSMRCNLTCSFWEALVWERAT